ncbi:NLR family CARD domain-containing protein 3-like isoform X1 [Esox lucius]|uniref:NLR family CARD domain-containing protein 3-like isoform X1 n=1 Tax=Esox lucius TaxID=8010 RepID=UPI0014775127|nr:NLR family CARD domain-containing protein 3-like isoform X1 [Esox lucius]
MSISGEREEEFPASKMSPPGEREEGFPASKMSLSCDHDITAKSGRSSLTVDQSRCSVCELILRDPVSINCGHWFCRQCITRYWEQPDSSGEYVCPQCRKRSRTRPVLQQLSEPSEDDRGSENKLYITEGESEGVNEHELWQLETASRTPTSHDTAIHCNDIFKPLPGQEKPIRTVLTKGIAGIGKTVSVQKFIVDWAEGKANQDVDVIFVLPFRELNLIRDQQYSLLRLLSDFNTDLDKHSVNKLVACKSMFIFDGLDESRLPVDFHCNKVISDVTQTSSVDVLMTNLIKGNLLPSALLWITTRPAAANQIPPGCVDLVTEVRGFYDPQKEEYFRKRFSDEDLASRIISHIKTSRSLHIMCHIPVFCWILAIVLEHMLTTDKRGEMPKTLTEMFTHFLFIQTSHKNQKYHGRDEMEAELMESDKDVLLKLGKLAFEQLEKGNLIFYEEDLKECGINVREASVYSGVCTEIFKEESVLFQRVVYCFVHLSIQEFLSAVYMYHCYTTQNMDALKPFLKRKTKASSKDLTLHELLKSTVDKALESKNGHLDLFVRFLHGLSVVSNQKLLRGLVTQTERSPESFKKTVRSLKGVQKKNISHGRWINLFHCLIEMKDHSVQEEIQKYLQSAKRYKNLTLAHCSALAFMLQISEDVLDVFDLKKYKTSQEGRWRLLPAVRGCRKALLAGCKLTTGVCEIISSALSSNPSHLTEMDLSDNLLKNSGVKMLSTGLGHPHCKLETLRLSGCLVTKEGCSSLVSALKSNPSHLKELDLSYNHPGDSGVKLLSAGLEDPHWRLEKLNMDHGGEWRLKSGLKKYVCDLTLDPNTVNRNLSLSEENRKVTWREEEQLYPDHPERFKDWPQVLCREGLSGRCYWEVEWSGRGAGIGVTYKEINRRGGDNDCGLGYNDKSWGLFGAGNNFSVCHNKNTTFIPVTSSDSNRVGVYLDCLAGTLSFYRVSSDTLTHLYTFNTTFTEPLYPGFYVYINSSVSLCQMVSVSNT